MIQYHDHFSIKSYDRIYIVYIFVEYLMFKNKTTNKKKE
jgi:hypothetical protein